MDKVIDIEERIPTLRERRKKRTNRKFVALLFIFLVLLGVLLYSQTKYSKIQDIHVTGAELYNEEEYQRLSELTIGDSMWSFSEKEIEKNLNELEWVEKSSVNKKWLTGVEIEIQEFEGIGYLDKGNSYQMVLSNGFPLEKPVEAVSGPIFSNFDDDKNRTELVSQLTEVKPVVYNLISQIILKPSEERTAFVTLYMNDGNEVRGLLSSLAEKLNYYPSVVAQLEDGQKGVIDMEVGIFFRSYDDVYGPRKEGAENEKPAEPEQD
ncbi:FtsQ-type POTRA domain-containing protein [Planococcus shenhongbingii]|uniref:Cell division protein DivIB n=1 Tax=Planococcus shenhongbingii TaxID=3058398 RepID=A0ABT8N8P7_9BACL|nr:MULTISPECIES: FtsQ-type POTRA domain-containing protein [unclassified Planococcus (in: firmicutes)]MDN7244270.1 FtsQ-type POTRA domain-containing protein [Planococcus sp. N017]WKA57439.1 FtsQ-type POTRA domain-containing protein [Planococcus sp. N016]